LLLLVAGSNANVIRPRSPQDTHAPKAKGKGLGPFGIDLSFLQGFDGAKLGPFLGALQPYFRPAAKSGSIPKFLNRYVPAMPLANRVVLKPQVRATAQRTKSRLGPLILAGKGVRDMFRRQENLTARSKKSHHFSPRGVLPRLIRPVNLTLACLTASQSAQTAQFCPPEWVWSSKTAR